MDFWYGAVNILRYAFFTVFWPPTYGYYVMHFHCFLTPKYSPDLLYDKKIVLRKTWLFIRGPEICS